MMMNNLTFLCFCEVVQNIFETRGTNAKTRLCEKYFSGFEDDESLNLAAQFLGEGAFSDVSGKRASVGSRTVSTLAADFCEIDYDLVFKPCRTATGSSSETIEKLLDNIPAAREKWKGELLSLKEVEEIYHQLFRVISRIDKQGILQQAWSKMTPLEVKYFIRIMGQGSLRIGFETRSVVNAIAGAFGKETDAVRYTHMITGSLGKTAVLAKWDELDSATFRIFHPLSFMLASPVESRAVKNYSAYVAEEKFDGMRCQAHISKNRVELFSRDLNNVTNSFPEISAFLSGKTLPDVVLDGEICVYKDDTILPFQLLQKRMGVKKPSKKILAQYPVLLISYDVLFFEGTPAFEKTLLERRKLLNLISEKHGLPITTQNEIKDEEHIQELFKRALAHGNEGLMLKLKNSTYEYGQRKKSWLKVKQPGGSIDTVIMYAHAGSGKRGGKYSDFTLGISVKDDERYEEEFIPIGKAYGGYSNKELDEINKKLKEITVERYGPTLGLLPEIIVELEFDAIQINRRTKANYTLRLPRFKAIRWDLSSKDVDTLEEIERMYKEKMEIERLTQTSNPSFHLPSQF
ncbi:MAG: ATP-dependent DNA ligase [Balneolaceae bacterium]